MYKPITLHEPQFIITDDDRVNLSKKTQIVVWTRGHFVAPGMGYPRMAIGYRNSAFFLTVIR